jgi:hypothetical protein
MPDWPDRAYGVNTPSPGLALHRQNPGSGTFDAVCELDLGRRRVNCKNINMLEAP